MTEGQQLKVAPHDQCTGCTACYSGCSRDAIVMVRDDEGFLYPHISDKCIDCGHCGHICPARKQREVRSEPTVFAAWLEAEAVRERCAGGGVFYALAEYVLELGGVVFGPAMDEKQQVCHVAVKDKNDIPALLGIIPVQSRLGDTFHRISYYLEQGRQVLFYGTPCQVDGLYRYLGEHPEHLLTCDILCSGMASPSVWEKLMESMAYIKRGHPLSVHFADKLSGQRERRFRVWFDGGATYDAPLRHCEFGRGFFRGLFLRPSCHTCRYANTNRVADLSLGIYEGLPKEYAAQQKKGISLLLVNSVKGAHVFDTLPLHRERRPMDEALAGNAALRSAPASAENREEFFKDLHRLPFRKVCERFFAPVVRKGSSVGGAVKMLGEKLWKKH